MEEHKVKILKLEDVTHDVKRFTLERPVGYSFQPGQATEVAINKPEWKNERRPFTFTGLNEDTHLEFTIKRYADHKGVTDALHQLKVGDELLIHDVWGTITYKGKGVFIAGGAGVTPFIAILRQLSKEGKINGHKLIFANKKAEDIIMRDEFERMLGKDFINILSREGVPGMHQGHIDKKFLRQEISNFSQHFYVCGPDKFIEVVKQDLGELGASADTLVFEK